ncbi:MAG: iron ABC transporter permease [Deltaproteobacteria bacterium]|nr:iron ABC transporter permease [Deltaproteobacteria bacterium]
MIESFFDPRLFYAVKQTLILASVSTFFAGLIGLPFGIAAAFHPRSEQLRKILSLPFGVPGLIAAFAWIAILGKSGWLIQIFQRFGFEFDFLYSLKSVILALVFFNIPFVALLISLAISQIPQDQIDVARGLGAKPFRVLKDILWPSIRSAFAGSCAQVFCFCMTSFALVLILGGGPQVQSLETSIYRSLRFGEPQWDLAIAASFWQIILSLIPFFIFYLNRNAFAPASFSAPLRKIQKNSWNWILSLLTILLIAPYLLFMIQSVPTFFRIENFYEFIKNISGPLWLSIKLGFCAALLTLCINCFLLWLAYKKPRLKPLLELLAQAPSGISILVIGIGFWILFSRWIDPFEGSFFAMVILQSISFLPFSFRWLRWLEEKRSPLLFEAAQNLGASRTRAFFSADWPRWKTPVAFVFAMIFGASIGELAALSLFYSEKLMPFSVLISRLLSQYRFEEATAVSVLMLCLSLGSMAFIVTKFSRNPNL